HAPERLRNAHRLITEVAVQDEEELIQTEARARFTAIEPKAQGARIRVVPSRAAEIGPEPGDVAHAIVIEITAEEELALLQDRVAAAECDRLAEEFKNIGVLVQPAPVVPADLVVLAVGVVVAVLGAQELVAAEHHRRA